MAASRPKSPGWYPEPDILPGSRATLRYWNGRHWTDRRRPMPVLTNLDLVSGMGVPHLRALEGPARHASLPAPAAEISATREAPSALTDRPERTGGPTEARGADRPASPGGGRGIPPVPPEPGGGGGGGGDREDGEGGGSGATKKRQKKWWVFAGVAVLAAIAVALAGQAMRPKPAGPRVLTDGQFVRAANVECAKTMPTLRPPDGGPLGSKVTPAQAADQIDKAAVGLDDLATRLGALPAVAADRPHIAGWLNDWHDYAATGHVYATDLRVHGASGKAPAVLTTAAALARSADHFSKANGLGNCLFAFPYNPDPSQF
jgi:hypothetical protein